MNWRLVSGRTLAYLGDAVWSLIVREYLVVNGAGNGSKLQQKTVSYVNARAQASYYDSLHEAQFFTEEEEEAFKRGRNDSAGTVPRGTPTATYRKSTGFEAIIGMLKLTKNMTRIEEIFERVITLREEKECHN